jgi:serine/threonine protein kinase
MAPEVFMQSEYDGKADIWSLGITAIEMATGNPPHVGSSPLQLVGLIPKVPPPRLEGEGGGWTEDFQDFVAQCCQMDPKARPTIKSLQQSRFIRRYRSDRPDTVLRDLTR